MASQKKAFNGVITKFIDNFGFVDDDVFFRIEVVEGGPVKVNDQVYVECEYSEQLPFKWNATKVKLLGPGRVAPTYLQHRMQQMLQQHSLQQTNSMNVAAQQIPQKAAQDQANFFTPELRKLIEKQQQQPQLQAFQPAIQNAPPPQQFARQNDFNQSPAFSGQITYTSTPGSAFVSPVMPFNQAMNTQQQQQQQTLPMAGMRMNFANNPTNNYPKRDNLNRKDDHRNIRDNRDRPGIVRKDDHRDRRDRDNDKRDDRRDTRDRDRENSRDVRESSRDSRDRKNITTTRDRRTTVSPSGSVNSSITSRRRYVPLNIPIHEILRSPINSYDIKRKYDASIHIPSDFKELQINGTFELNFQSLYKPIQYRIINTAEEADEKKENEKKENEKKESKKSSEDSKSKKDSSSDSKKESKESSKESSKETSKEASKESSKETSKENNVSDEAKDESSEKANEKTDKPEDENSKMKSESKSESKSDSKESTSKSSSKKKSSTPLSDKYAVKVLLLSFPSMNNIYDRVLEKDGHSKTSYFQHFNKIFSYLCLKNHNDGHALIGGKFDPKLDGYITEGTPNLIQTAVRCVKQQTGIDLSSCKKWKHMCTFLYNRDESPFYENVAFEYSNIFIPDVWSLLENPPPPPCIKSEANHKPVDTNKFVDKLTSSSQTNSIKSEQPDSDSMNHSLENSKIDSNGGDSFSQVHPSNSLADETNPIQSSDSSIASQIARLNELKVTDLRAELEKFGHKPAKNVKKADLVNILTGILKSQQSDGVSKAEEELEEGESPANEEETEQQPNEAAEEENAVDESMEAVDSNAVDAVNATETTGKRKAEDQSSSEQSAKKIKPEQSKEEAKDRPLEAVQDGQIVAYGSSMSVLNLHQALNHDKYDHFELQITSELLREALTEHFCSYILSACYENRHLLKEQDDKKDDLPAKDLPENNYVLLAFSYFDSCHCGYLTVDDLQKLLSCCGVNFSKRTWTYMFGSGDKIKYRNFKEPSKVYSFATIEQKVNKQLTGKSAGDEPVKNSLYVKDGSVFDIDKLIAQSESDERTKAELKDRLKLAEDTIRNLQASLSESNARRDKVIAANKKQNEEICDYKRDKERIKHKYDESLKLINSTLGHFNDFIRKHEDKPEKVREKETKESKEIKESNDH